ncbi:MAG: helix-turn-helix domain-containing protein [Phycisphaerae bacterium]|nr:helix-turn-helix domain-containing protein [Phycisphaerae bacterium]
MAENREKDITRRIAQVRMELDGPRGKTRFAGRLGISLSTYANYEASRVPSAELLVKIADIAGVDLRWLLTGTAAESGQGVAPQHPAVRRAAEMLAQHPDAAEPLAAFLDILAGTFAFPQKNASAAISDTSQYSAKDSAKDSASVAAGGANDILSAGGDNDSMSAEAGQREVAGSDPARDWIPILGRSAAGVSQYWDSSDDIDGLTTLTQLIDKHKSAIPEQMDVHAGVVTCELPAGSGAAVQIITLRNPDESGVAEFVCAPQIKSAYNDAFAVRIDGESMNPEIRHGDLLILSPSIAAVPYKPAVVQLRDAIGVTCKLYQPSAGVPGVVNLVPINEQFSTLTIQTKTIQWAFCMLGKIRSRG